MVEMTYFHQLFRTIDGVLAHNVGTKIELIGHIYFGIFCTGCVAKDFLIPCPSWFPHDGCDPSQSVQLVLIRQVWLQSSNPGQSIKIVGQIPPHSPGVNVCEGPHFDTNFCLINYFRNRCSGPKNNCGFSCLLKWRYSVAATASRPRGSIFSLLSNQT